MKLQSILACALLIPTFASAEDYTLKEKRFQQKTTLNAIFLPSQSTPIKVKPKVWYDFFITSLVDQGSKVKKGDTLIGIDTEKIDRYLDQAKKNKKSAELKLAQSKAELAQLEITTPIKLEDAARREKETAENLKWYQEIGKAQNIAEAKHSVSKLEESLSYAKEELKQLLKMYEEDDKIEETEEVILKRTRNNIANAEFSLKSLKIKAEKTLNTVIPRTLLSLELAAKNAKIANAEAKEKLPRELEQKRLDVAKAIRDDKLASEKLEKIKADRAMMNITAPADGVVYYGDLASGKWTSTAATKALHIGAKLPANLTLMTFIPAKTSLELSAFVPETSLTALRSKDAVKGYATTSLNPFKSFPVTLTNLNAFPETNGSFRVSIKPELPKELSVVPGMKASVTLTSLDLDKALTIPVSFLKAESDGTFTVKLKLADGKTDVRTVSVGQSNKTDAIITKGLEKGQVIVK